MKPVSFSPRVRRSLWIALALLTVFTITGFFILPPIVKTQLEQRASAALGRTVTVGKVRLNPYTLSMTLEDFDVRLKEGNGSFLGWKRLYVNFDALASVTGDWVLSEIELDGFHAAVAVKPDGSLSFSDILAKVTALTTPVPGAAPARPMRPIRIGSLKVTQAQVNFADESRKKPFATLIGPLTFALTEFRTAGARGAPYHFAAVTEAGEKLAWTGTISAEPFRSVGELTLEDIILPKYAPYYADFTSADLAEGKLSVHGHYEINLTAGQRVLRLTDGSVQVRGLKLLERASQAVAVELPSLDIFGVNADALTLKATVGSVNLTGGHLHLRREKDGAINLLTMLQPAPDAAPATPAAAPAPPAKLPDVSVTEVALKDFQVEIADLAAPRAAQLGLSGLQVNLKNATLTDGAVMPLQLSLNWAPQGTVRLEGTVALKPELKADLKVDVADFAISPLSPYIEQFVNARITQGAVTTSLTAQVSLPAGQPPVVTVAGDVQVARFGLVDGEHNEELAGFGSLTLKGLHAATAPQLSLALDEVAVVAPYARVIVLDKDMKLNLSSVLVAQRAAAAGEPVPTPASAPKIVVGKVLISEGEYTFSDHSIEPNVRMAINQFEGTITGLSSENLTKADVNLKATVDGAGPISVTGKLDPFGATRHVDLKIDFKNVDLLPVSPYSGKYAGYELARGKLALDIKFLLEGDKIDATDLITLNQFTFGAPVQSPDATSLPVRLGVALLKDTEGKIVIDVPVQGSLTDPNFRIGKVVWRVIINLLTKAAVSPFGLLGSMFGGGGDELGYQDFAPGAAVLQATEIKKLETMVKALTNRPGLSVDLEGSYDGPADTFALKQNKLADAVRRAIWEAKHATDPTVAPPEQLVITPEENAVMVKKLFDEKFPPGTQFGAPLGKAPVAAAPPPPAKKGFIGRVVDFVTFKNARSEKPAAVESAKPEAVKPGDAAVTGPSIEEMTGRLAETIVVTDNDLRALAQARAQHVRDYFINVGKIDPERLFLAKNQADATNAAKGPRVFLNLQ